MSASATLAVVAAPTLDAAVEEFLRLCVGLVAAGGTVQLVELGCGRGVLSGEAEKPAEVERQLEGLASFGTTPYPVSAAELRDLLALTDRVLRVAAPARRGTPALVSIDAAWLMHVSDDALLLAFEQAGQLIKG